MVVDVRGLGNFQTSQFSYIYGPGGERLWPTQQQIANVNSTLANEGLLSYFHTEGEISSQYGEFTTVRATGLVRDPQATNTVLLNSAQLDAAAAAQFQTVGSQCRLVYLY